MKPPLILATRYPDRYVASPPSGVKWALVCDK